MFTNFFRVFKFGWQEFSRNIGLSLGTIFVIFIAISLIGGTFLLKGVSTNLINSIQEKVDVSVYFEKDAKEKEIFEIRDKLKNFPEVKSVEYVSEEAALKEFKKTHEDNSLIEKSLDEIEGNPLSASLNIRAEDASSYDNIRKYLEEGEYKNIIDKTNYRRNKPIIEKLFSISEGINKGGTIVSAILVFIAVLVIFNTIRLAIYSRGKEISIMKLIGATNWFVRGPFIVQGIIMGIFAGAISFLLFYGIDTSLVPKDLGIFGELGFLSFFEKNILIFLAIQLGGGVFLGMFSAFIACQRHLKV